MTAPRWFGFPLLVLLAAGAAAQDRARIAGSVQDPSGAAVAGAFLTAVNQADGARRTVSSDTQGRYVVPWLAPGTYKVTARKPGFQTVAYLDVSAGAGEEVPLDITLSVGSVREVITVTAGPGPVNTRDAAVGAAVGKDWLDTLPVSGRGLLGVLDLAPGVVATPAASGDAGQFSTSGQRANTNQFQVDGVNANGGISGSGLPAPFPGGALPAMTAFGSLHNLVSLEELQEVRLRTSSYAPEFGRLPGAQVALETRAGSNHWHGSAFGAARHESLAANDWFANAGGLSRAPHRLAQWGGSLGGPLRTDHTFFFASNEGIRLRQPLVWRASVPSIEARRAVSGAARALLDAFPLPGGPPLGDGLAGMVAQTTLPAALDSGSLRIDHALTPRLTLFSRYNRAPSRSDSGYSQVESARFGYWSLTAGATALVGPSSTFDLRWNVSRVGARSEWRATGAGGAVPVDLSAYLPASPDPAHTTYGVAIGGAGRLVSGARGLNRQGQANLVGVFAWQNQAHSPRLGFDYLRLTPSRSSASLAIAGVYDSLTGFLNGAPPQVSMISAEPASSLIETLSLYAQDTWRPRPQLALTFGLRWEITPSPSVRQSPSSFQAVLLPLPGVAPADPVVYPTPAGDSRVSVTPSPAVAYGALWPTRYGQVAPRIGLAWRLRERAVFRAGWGLFYDLGFGAATDPINGYPFNRWNSGTGVGGPPVAMGGEFQARGGSDGLDLPRAQHWNAALEFYLTRSDLLSLSYVGSAGRKLLRREGASEPGSRLAQSVAATNNGASDYHGAQVEYRRTLTAGLQARAAYTWSHSIDNGSWDSAFALVSSGLPPERDRGASSFDVRHALTAALSWRLPRAARAWTLSAVARARTGFPIDVLWNENLLGIYFDNVTRPDLAPGVPVWLPDPRAPHGRRLNRAAFTQPDSIQGNLGRNAIRGFGMWQADAAVERPFAVRERWRLDLRLEVFNLFNRANLADPVRCLASPLFGAPGSMLNLMLGSGSPDSGLAPSLQVGGPRFAQAVLRFRF